MKKILLFILILSILPSFAACGDAAEEAGENGGVTEIVLGDENIKISGSGAKARDNVLSINAGGTYEISGKLSEGQLLVNTGEAPADVRIILAGAEINNSADSAVLIEQAGNTHIEIKEGTENLISSGVQGSEYDENTGGAAIYAMDDLDIEGSGKLSVKAYINNGIGCKDDLDIKGGSLHIYAVNNGVRASESIELKGGSLSIEAGNDGMKTSSAKKEGKGYVEISGGEISINAGGDGISAESEVRFKEGNVSVNCSGNPQEESSKAVKAKTDINIEGGNLSFVSQDHAVSCDGNINVSGGKISLSSGDDGIKALGNINISGGEISLAASGDGLQAGSKSLSSKKKISISGGEIYISSYKQALDSAEMEISGGTVFALQNTEPRGGFENSGTQSCIYDNFPGSKGNTAQVCGKTLTAENAFKSIVFSSPELTSGESYVCSDGIGEVKLTAK